MPMKKNPKAKGGAAGAGMLPKRPAGGTTRWPWDDDPVVEMSRAEVYATIEKAYRIEHGADTRDPLVRQCLEELHHLFHLRMLCIRTIDAAEKAGKATDRDALRVGAQDAHVALRATNAQLTKMTRQVRTAIRTQIVAARTAEPEVGEPAMKRFKVVK